jgi:cell division protein FtsL
MAKKKTYRKRKTYRKKKDSRFVHDYGGRIFLLGILSVIMLAIYLYRKVEVDFSLRGNDELRRESQRIRSELGGLRIQVNDMKRYERIVELAKKQGLDFLSASQLKELPVDIKGMELHPEAEEYSLRYAGFAILGNAKKMKQDSSKFRE